MPRRHSAARLFVEGLAVGGAVGVVLGLMLAPDKGREVRRRVAFLLDSWAGQVGGLVDRLGTPAASEARHDAEAVVADAREQAARLLDEADALISEVRQRRGGAPGGAADGRG